MIILALSGWVTAVIVAVLMARALAAQAERVAWACHELRGPVSVIGLGVELAVKTGGLSRAKLGALELELSRLRQSLDDLSAAASVSSRRYAPGRGTATAVDVGVLLAESVEGWRAAADGRELILDPDPAQPAAAVRGERVRLAQAIGNLLANALEHGSGRITVRSRVSARCVRIEVLDEGPGLVSAAALGRTRRLSIGRRAPARGHGLRIVGAVARAHGGRLFSAPAADGARLVLELPLAAVTGRSHTHAADGIPLQMHGSMQIAEPHGELQFTSGPALPRAVPETP